MEILDFPDEILDYIVSLLNFNSWKNLSRTNKLFFDLTTPYIVENCAIDTNRSDKNLCSVEDLQRNYVNVKIDKKPITLSESITPKNVYITVTNGRVANQLLQNPQSFQFINECSTVKNVFLNIQSNEQEEPNVPEFLLRNDINFYIDKLTITLKTSENVWNKVRQWVLVCPGIRKLCIIVGRYAEEDEVGDLARSQFNFEELSLKNVGSKKLVSEIVNSSMKLKSLILENCQIDGLEVSRSLLKFECINKKVKSIESLLSKQIYLESVIIDKVKFTKELLNILSRNIFLTTLEIFYCQLEDGISNEDFSFVSRIVSLKLISLTKNNSSIKDTRITDIEEISESGEGVKLEEIVWNNMESVETLHVQLTTTNLQKKVLNRLKHIEILDMGRKTSVAVDQKIVASSLIYCIYFSVQSKMFPNCHTLHAANPIENISILKQLLESLKDKTVKTVYLKWYSITSQQIELFCKSDLKNITFYIDFPIVYAMIFDYESMFEMASSFKEKYNIQVESTGTQGKSFVIIKDTMKVFMRNKMSSIDQISRRFILDE